jgi:hypothetical protein
MTLMMVITMVAMTPVKPDDNKATVDSSNSDRFTDPVDLLGIKLLD